MSHAQKDRKIHFRARMRDKRDKIRSNIQITRAEVWVTNRTNRTENVRNLVALQDIGETENLLNPSVIVS